MTEQYPSSAQSETAANSAVPSHAAVGPLSIRDLWVLGSVAIIFIASVVPIVSNLGGSFNLWNVSGLFYIGVGVVLPLAVGGLFATRRLSPESRVRIGSLSIDQFASVVAGFATFFFFIGTVTDFGIVYLLGLVGSLLLLAGTAGALWIPLLATDFAGRAEVPAHVAARDALPAPQRPATAKPASAKSGAVTHFGHGGTQQGSSSLPGQSNHDVANQGVASPGDSNQGEDGQGDSSLQSTGGWVASQAPSSHTAAGQIFTPAKETKPTQSASAQPGAAAASIAASTAAAGNAATQAVSAAAPGAAAAKSSADTTAEAESASSAQSNASQPATLGESAGSSPVAGASSADSPSRDASADVSAASTPDAATSSLASQSSAVQSAAHQGSAAATTLNPQVAAAAKESIAATVRPKSAAAAVIAEPFWFAVDRPQNVIDEKTRQFLFKLAPGAWILALEDRGNSFLVQDSHGKTGVLLDLVGIERASDSQ